MSLLQINDRVNRAVSALNCHREGLPYVQNKKRAPDRERVLP